MDVLKRITYLEKRDHGHADQAEFMTEQINTTVKICEPKSEEHKKKIEDAIIWLLSEFRYEGQLRNYSIDDDDIENDHWAT